MPGGGEPGECDRCGRLGETKTVSTPPAEYDLCSACQMYVRRCGVVRYSGASTSHSGP